MHFIVFPLSVIDLSIREVQLSITLSHLILFVSLIVSPICILLYHKFALILDYWLLAKTVLSAVFLYDAVN